MTLPEDPRITEFREWNRNLDKITDQATIQAQIEALEGYGEDFWVAYAERMRQSSIEMFGRLVLDEGEYQPARLRERMIAGWQERLEGVRSPC